MNEWMNDWSDAAMTNDVITGTCVQVAKDNGGATYRVLQRILDNVDE